MRTFTLRLRGRLLFFVIFNETGENIRTLFFFFFDLKFEITKVCILLCSKRVPVLLVGGGGGRGVLMNDDFIYM